MNKIAEFYAKVVSDEKLREKVSGILAGKEIAEIPDEDLQRIGILARELGYSLDLAEAKKYLATEEIAVTDEAMDAVAGGKKKIRCEGKDAGAYYDEKNNKWYDRKTGKEI